MKDIISIQNVKIWGISTGHLIISLKIEIAPRVNAKII